MSRYMLTSLIRSAYYNIYINIVFIASRSTQFIYLYLLKGHGPKTKTKFTVTGPTKSSNHNN